MAAIGQCANNILGELSEPTAQLDDLSAALNLNQSSGLVLVIGSAAFCIFLFVCRLVAKQPASFRAKGRSQTAIALARTIQRIQLQLSAADSAATDNSKSQLIANIRQLSRADIVSQIQLDFGEIQSTLFHRAARFNCARVFDALVTQSGLSLATISRLKTANGSTVLHEAASCGNLELVAKVVGACHDEHSHDVASSVYQLISRIWTRRSQRLEAVVLAQDAWNGTPVEAAIRGGHIPTAELLLACKEFDVAEHAPKLLKAQWYADSHVRTRIHKLICNYLTDDELRDLDFGLMVNADRELLDYYIARGLDPNVRYQGECALEVAIQFGHHDRFRRLLQAGADLKQVDLGHALVHTITTARVGWNTVPRDAGVVAAAEAIFRECVSAGLCFKSQELVDRVWNSLGSYSCNVLHLAIQAGFTQTNGSAGNRLTGSAFQRRIAQALQARFPPISHSDCIRIIQENVQLSALQLRNVCQEHAGTLDDGEEDEFEIDDAPKNDNDEIVEALTHANWESLWRWYQIYSIPTLQNACVRAWWKHRWTAATAQPDHNGHTLPLPQGLGVEHAEQWLNRSAEVAIARPNDHRSVEGNQSLHDIEAKQLEPAVAVL